MHVNAKPPLLFVLTFEAFSLLWLQIVGFGLPSYASHDCDNYVLCAVRVVHLETKCDGVEGGKSHCGASSNTQANAGKARVP